MSTKTTFKRIALVTVAALGFGVLSVAPSNSAIVVQSLSIDSATDAILTGETATAVLTNSFVSNLLADSVTVTGVITSSNGSYVEDLRLSTAETSASTGNAYVSLSNASKNPSATETGTAADNTSKTVTMKLNARLVNVSTAGTYTVTFYVTRNPGVGAPTIDTAQITWTVTVTAADTKASAASVSTLRTGAATGEATTGIDSTVVASRSILSTVAGNITVTQKNAAGLTAVESLTAVVTGPAFLSTSNSRPTSGAAMTVAAGEVIYVWSTGTAGKATIAISSVSGVAIATETVNFYGPQTKIETQAALLNKTVARAAGFATTGFTVVTVSDANGVGVPSLSVTALSSNAAAIASVVCTYDATTAGDYSCDMTSAAGSKSGDKSTITFRAVDPAVTTSTAYLTTTLDVTVGGSVAKEVITLDKASYSPGEQMIITITATDASGNPVYDGKTTPALTSNKSIQGLDQLAASYTAGKADSQGRSATTGAVSNAYRVYAPASSGEFIIKGTSGNTAGDVISVTGTVADSAQDAATDAANEATDAANAATDAALAAADAADAATAAAQDASDAVAALSASVSKLISSLRAQITSLTNLVIKIQKKVRA
jgi:trimeric autotransporter adhesin